MADKILEMIRGGAKIVDVRSPEEYNDEHYANAVNIPVNELQARLAELGDKASPLVLYCASGARSAQAARLLKQSGYVNVVNAGGLDDMPS